MKLLKCTVCQDMVAVRPWSKSCHCKQSKGLYLDNNETIQVEGPCIVLGFPNSYFFTINEPNPSVMRKEVVKGG